MKTTTRWLAAAGLGLSLFIIACNKENGSSSNIPAGKTSLSVYMMDDPVQFTKVLIDIKQVVVKIDTAVNQRDSDDNHQWDDDWCGFHRNRDNNSTIWDTLSITPGVYDLLQLRNGVDTLLASGLIPSGKVLKVRVTLGTDNTIYTDSSTHYPLNIIGPNNYFDINVRALNVAIITNNQFNLWLDFNLFRSVFFIHNEFWLRPELVAFNDHAQPKVQGQVLPGGASPLVKLFNDTDTLYALPGHDGRYLIRNVDAGTYSINFLGQHGYQDTTISNIVVNASGATNVPAVTLHQ